MYCPDVEYLTIEPDSAQTIEHELRITLRIHRHAFAVFVIDYPEVCAVEQDAVCYAMSVLSIFVIADSDLRCDD